MTTRREFALACALVLLLRPVGAQSRLRRLGFLSPIPREKSHLTGLLLRSLSQLGYREGVEIVVEYRSADSIEQRYPLLARELIDAKCDLLIALAVEPAARALRDARSAVPALFVAVEYDPVEKGIVRSLGRPGGNMTGIHFPVGPLIAKRIEIAREIRPGARRFLIFSDAHSQEQLAVAKSAANSLGLELTIVQFGPPPHDLAGAFKTGLDNGIEFFLPLTSASFFPQLSELSELIVRHRVPAIGAGWYMELQPDALLLSYSNDIARHAPRAAEIAVRILKGAKPADIPVEQPDAFELIVNLRTAKALGIKVPYTVLARATKVIE